MNEVVIRYRYLPKDIFKKIVHDMILNSQYFTAFLTGEQLQYYFYFSTKTWNTLELIRKTS